MRFYNYLKQNLFIAPYPLLPLAVFTYFVLCFLLDPNSTFRTHQLLDPDDYMRLNQAINWLQGQGWHDLSHPRLSPGEHVSVNWSRLVDLPIVFFMLPFVQWLGIQNAALIASFIVPITLFGLLLAVMTSVARPLIGKDRANLAAVMLLFMPAILFNFSPGRVDHHGYHLLVSGFGLLCLERLMLCRRGFIPAIAGGIVWACGLWIGAECLPWLIIFCSCLTIYASWRGGVILRNAALFGLTLALASTALLPLAVAPQEFSNFTITWFSAAYTIFSGLIGLVFILGWLLGRKVEKIWLRMMLMAILALLSAIVFFALVPEAWRGPYADFDVITSSLILDNVSEAQPFLAALHLHIYNPKTFLFAIPASLRTIFLPFFGLIIVGYNVVRTFGRRRQLWIMHGAFLVPALLLTLFWQLRVSYFAQLFSLVPVSWLLWVWWDVIATRLSARPRFWAEVIAFLCLGGLPVVLLPDMATGAALYPDLLFFPAAHPASACPLIRASEFLSAPWGYGDHPRVILAGMDDGPELLFRTPHMVLAAPYNVHGNRDVFDFFNARNEADALTILRRRHVDLVLVCRHIAAYYAGFSDKNPFGYIQTDNNGFLHVHSSKDHLTMIEKLVGEAPIPSWLKPVEIVLDKDYLLFEVHLPKNSSPK